MTIKSDENAYIAPIANNTLTKADLIELLKQYPDNTQVRVIINEQDIQKAESLRNIESMPLEFELSKLYVKTDDDLKINAWVHVSRLPTSSSHEQDEIGLISTHEDESEYIFKGRMQGWVKWFNTDKGIGFIQTEGIWRDIFVHYKDIEHDGFKSLMADDVVEFSLYLTPRGLRAKQVEMVNDMEDMYEEY